MSHKILVADDEKDNRVIARETLESAGYQVVEAETGPQVLERAAADRPDLILLDLSMPEQDGWQTARRLKADPQTRAIVVVAFTAHAMLGDDKKALNAGCDGYLSKPCTPREILKKVAEHLGEKK